MNTVTLFGAGKIGDAITGLLSMSGRYAVRVCDVNEKRAQEMAASWKNAEGFKLDLDDKAYTKKLLQGSQAVLSALPFYCNPAVAEFAASEKVHYLDLTEDVATTDKVAEVAADSNCCFMPQCGLAPGFVSVAAMQLARSFDKVETIKMRVGALPIYPSNQLKYNLTWSTEGLINEYINPCEVIFRGKRTSAFALEGYERFSLNGAEYEAFNTSGGLGTLCDTLEGTVQNLDYKSIRYPGHRELMTFLMNDLRFNEDRTTLIKAMERSIPATAQDKCLIFVEVTGQVKGRLLQRTYASTVYNTILSGRHFSAIQLTTAAGICAPLDLLLNGKFRQSSGLIKTEEISLTDFLDNEFGKYYRDEMALSGIAA